MLTSFINYISLNVCYIGLLQSMAIIFSKWFMNTVSFIHKHYLDELQLMFLHCNKNLVESTDVSNIHIQTVFVSS